MDYGIQACLVQEKTGLANAPRVKAETPLGFGLHLFRRMLPLTLEPIRQANLRDMLILALCSVS
jgi:hypothetical protein